MKNLYNPFKPYNSIVPTTMSREELRNLARQHNVPRGRNKNDTFNNLLKANILKTSIVIHN